MAGDWIKMRESLHEDPAVLSMANALETRPEHVVGYCHRFWSWVSRNCHDGRVTGVRIVALESVLNLPGFVQMMRNVGWLEYDESDGIPVITIPKFDRHLSQGAKARGLNTERKRHARVPDLSLSKRDKSKTREEKRREDIYTPTPNDSFLIAWNATSGAIPARRITGKRQRSLAERFRDPSWDWQAALAKFPLKCFAAEPGGWQPNIDWFLKPETVGKILEGAYDWTKPNPNAPPPPRVRPKKTREDERLGIISVARQAGKTREEINSILTAEGYDGL